MSSFTFPLAAKSEERLASAIQEARSWRHANVEPEHVLFADLKAEDEVLSSAVSKSGISPNAIKDALERRLKGLPVDPAGPRVRPRFGPRMRAILDAAGEAAKGEPVRWEQVVSALLERDDDDLLRPLRDAGLDVAAARSAVGRAEALSEAGVSAPADDPLMRYCEDLTARCAAGRVLPLVGREQEIRLVSVVLGQKLTSNPLLIGDPGVGKTAVVEGLALAIHRGEVVPSLRGKRILVLDVGALLAGATYRGEFEERLKKVVDAVRSAAGQIILFIDEIHGLMGAGRAGGGPDAANLLKPALARGEVSVIGATTHAEFRLHIEKDVAFSSRFEKIEINEPSPDETLAVLTGLKETFEKHHGVTYADAAVRAIVRYADRYITGERFPRKAVKLLDRVGADVALRVALSGAERDAPEVVGVSDVSRSVAAITGIPVDRMAAAGSEIRRLEDALSSSIVGQSEVVRSIVERVRIASSGLGDPFRPRAVSLFLGTTGVGKTEVAKIMARELYGDPRSLVRLDMSEFSEKVNVQRLIGAPPGTVGYEEGGALTEAVKIRPYSLVLLDEFDKAHPEVWKLFQQVFDEGRLTDNKGQTVNFKSCVFVATSNQHAEVLFDERIGSLDERKQELVERFKTTCAPEFFQRIDDVLVFDPLDADDASRILDGFVHRFEARLSADPEGRLTGCSIELAPEARERLLATGFAPRYGARSLRGAVERAIGVALAVALEASPPDAPPAKIVTIECPDGQFRAVIHRESGSDALAQGR